jgi:hypothetical protein
MYTVLDDRKKAEQIKEYMEANPNAIRKQIYLECNITKYRANMLEGQGLIKLPLPLTNKQSLMKARVKSYQYRSSVNHGREYGKW